MVAFIQSRTLGTLLKKFKTCQLNENRLCIYQLKSKHNYSEKKQ